MQFVISALTAFYFIEVIRYSSLFAEWRANVEIDSPLVDKLIKCDICIATWATFITFIISYWFNLAGFAAAGLVILLLKVREWTIRNWNENYH